MIWYCMPQGPSNPTSANDLKRQLYDVRSTSAFPYKGGMLNRRGTGPAGQISHKCTHESYADVRQKEARSTSLPLLPLR